MLKFLSLNSLESYPDSGIFLEKRYGQTTISLKIIPERLTTISLMNPLFIEKRWGMAVLDENRAPMYTTWQLHRVMQVGSCSPFLPDLLGTWGDAVGGAVYKCRETTTTFGKHQLWGTPGTMCTDKRVTSPSLN